MDRDDQRVGATWQPVRRRRPLELDRLGHAGVPLLGVADDADVPRSAAGDGDVEPDEEPGVRDRRRLAAGPRHRVGVGRRRIVAHRLILVLDRLRIVGARIAVHHRVPRRRDPTGLRIVAHVRVQLADDLDRRVVDHGEIGVVERSLRRVDLRLVAARGERDGGCDDRVRQTHGDQAST